MSDFSPIRSLKYFRKSNQKTRDSNSLILETLEDRMMLSTVTIFAAGSTGEEDMKLVINDQVVNTFMDIGGDPEARDFQQISCEVPDNTTVGQIKIQFSNDLYDPDNGIDRNLTVDKIVLDGQTYQTESESVFSTGTWDEANGVVPGYGRGETLHANGYFAFGNNQQGTQLNVTARGEGGDAAFDILIDGQVAASFVATAQEATYGYFHSSEVSFDQVRIAFTNDQYDPENGVDVNLVVDFLGIGNTGVSTSDATVLSTGTWLPTDGVTPGFGRGNTLHANGYFQFASFESSQQSLTFSDEIGASAYTVEVDGNSGRIAAISAGASNLSGDTISLYEADGSSVVQFGNNGTVDLEQLTGLDPGNDFAIQDISFYPDGSLLLTGRNFNFVGVSVPYVIKMTTAGELDTSFNNGFFTNTLLGMTSSDSGKFESVIDPAGNATLVGNVFDSNNDAVLVRLTSGGQVDTNWGLGGTSRITGNGIGGFPDTDIVGAELLNDGSIMVALLHSNSLDYPPTIVAKITPSGFLDLSYGINGIATITPEQQFYGFSHFRADSQGRAILGSSQELARLNFYGDVDNSFSQNGRVNYSDGRYVEDGLVAFQGIYAMVIDNRDRIVLTSNIRTQTGKFSVNYDGTTVLRFDVDGRYDLNFDDDGIQELDVNSLSAYQSSGVALDLDGNLLITVGPTGSNTDPATGVRFLSRFRFA